MISEWIQKVGSSVPRGFSRYYVLDLLKTEPHTGKEIIDHAAQQSDAYGSRHQDSYIRCLAGFLTRVG